MLADKALTDVEWQRYRAMVDAVFAAGLTVEYYKATCGEILGPVLRESMAQRQHGR